MTFMGVHQSSAFIDTTISLFELEILLFAAGFGYYISNGVLIHKPAAVTVQQGSQAVMIRMKRAFIFVQMLQLVDNHTDHFELRLTDEVQQAFVKLLSLFRLTEKAEGTFAINNLRTMENNRIVRSKPPDGTFEILKMLRK